MELTNTHLQRIWWGLSEEGLLKLANRISYFHNTDHQREVMDLLQTLDKEAEAVDQHFANLGRQTMGHYFEQLLFYILEKDPRYSVLTRNHQIIEDGITKGELDLIVESARGREHWEIALKFYLQTEDSADHACFLGPSRKDFLARKMEKLHQHQIPLGQHPQVRAEFGPLRSGIFLKGQLFYRHPCSPLVQNALGEKRLYHFPLTQLAKILDPNGHYQILKKPAWIGPYHSESSEDVYTGQGLLLAIAQEFERIDRPQLIVRLSEGPRGLVEKDRFFACPDQWP